MIDDELADRIIRENKEQQLKNPSAIQTEDFYKTDRQVENTWLSWIASNALTEDEYNDLHIKFTDDPELYELAKKFLLPRCEFVGGGLVRGIPLNPKYIGKRRIQNDEVPARLEPRCFIFRAKAVDQIGADKLQQMMEQAEKDYDARGKLQGWSDT